jgi:hypothetical protein
MREFKNEHSEKVTDRVYEWTLDEAAALLFKNGVCFPKECNAGFQLVKGEHGEPARLQLVVRTRNIGPVDTVEITADTAGSNPEPEIESDPESDPLNYEAP